MKKYTIIYFLLLLPFLAIGGEINYYQGTWEQTLKKAKEENKYIMLDCYTDWCYWCKVMDKSTFKSDSILGLLNKNFICAHREMEKDAEGIQLSMKYHIQAFPTFLFFSSEGVLVKSVVGYNQTPAFYAALLDIGNGKGLESYPGYGPKMDPGFPPFYKASFGVKRVITSADTINAFLDAQKDLYGEVAWGVINRFSMNEKYSNWVLTNSSRLSALYGKDAVGQKIFTIINAHVEVAIEKKDEKMLESAFLELDKYLPGETHRSQQIYWRQQYYSKNGMWERLADMEQTIVDTSRISAISGSLNDLCWKFYEECNDIKICERTLPWMKGVVTYSEEYPSMDTYACLLYKTGHYAEAKIIAEKAIALGKKNNDKTESTEELLVKINEKLK